jgi:two-component system sensor histidine kinase BaeS
VFTNLLDNAVKYCPAGARVRLRAQKTDQRLRVEIADTGPGIEPRHQPRLFERFYRVESSRNRASGGAGLGLAICKNIAEAHEGTLTAQASPLGGLWIGIKLPLAA